MAMNKKEFLERLEKGLEGLPENDLRERLDFYGEMIDDRMEEGLSEEEAVSEIGSADEIAWQIIESYPLGKLVREKMKPKRKIRTWMIVLLVLGSPIWISLLAAAFAVIVVLYVSLWSIIVSLWAVFASLAGVFIGSIASSVAFLINDSPLTALAVIGGGLVSAGLSIFLFYGCRAATKGILLLTKRIVLGTKKHIMGKGES